MRQIIDSRHPSYDEPKYRKHRLIMNGGRDFVAAYLRRHTRESQDAFLNRRELAYNPGTAAAAVAKIVRASYQRLNAISREGGSHSYILACKGEEGGVDNLGNSMHNFIGKNVTPELLFMGIVGVMVDNVADVGTTLGSTPGHPYLYTYRAEDILNWSFSDDKRLQTLLLRDHFLNVDQYGLPTVYSDRYRLYQRTEQGIAVHFFNTKSENVGDLFLDLEEIPFVLGILPSSLLEDIADHQIALLNLMSSDLSYTWGANFPFYTEQSDGFADLMRAKEVQFSDTQTGQVLLPYVPNQLPLVPSIPKEVLDGTSEEVTVGPLIGRKYAKGLDRPAFIHPSPEPLRASMEKEEQIKRDIDTALHLTMSNFSDNDLEGLEAGLSYIGLEQETIEKQIARHWAAFSGDAQSPIIKYPEKYNLKSDKERREDAKNLITLQTATPSRTFQKAIGRDIARALYGDRLSQDEMQAIYDEIDNSKSPTADPTILTSDHEAGFVSTLTASMARGYEKGEAEQAAQDHADRLARIQMAQMTGMGAARGVPDNSVTPGLDAAKEKEGKDQRGRSKEVHFTKKAHDGRRDNRADVAIGRGDTHVQ